MRHNYSPQRFVLDHLHSLEQLWTKVRDGDPESVHQARVMTRRIRAGLALTWGLNVEVARTFRMISRRLGDVRELDVTRELLDNLQPQLPQAAIAITALGQDIGRAQYRQRRRLIKALDGINLRRLGRRIASAPAGWAAVSAMWHDWRDHLRDELSTRASTLKAAIDRASGVYMPNRVHDVRIAIKKLRYALELANATGASDDVQLVTELKGAQEVLGRLHDWQVLSRVIDKADLGDTASSRERAVLESVVAVESSRLHAKYLRRRDRLVDVCHACSCSASKWRALARLGRYTTGSLPAAGFAAVPFAVWYLRNHSMGDQPPTESMPPRSVSWTTRRAAVAR
jgi:CHAD domain-containing protein